MKKSVLLSFIAFYFIANINAQNLIAVQNGGLVNFYTDFHTALINATSGSTIYLPGGTFTTPSGNDTINTSVNIIGVGHYADSCLATSTTFLNTNLYFNTGSNNCILSGFTLNGQITPLGIINNLELDRINVRSIINLATDNLVSSPRFNAFLIRECVINEIEGDNAQYQPYNYYSAGTVRNSIVNVISNVYGLILSNNYIGNLGVYCYTSCTANTLNCTLSNNIIGTLGDAGNNSFINNIFFFAYSSTPSNTNFIQTSSTSINSTYNQSYSSTFVNATSFSFQYSFDYHLLSTSSGVNGGADGTDIGIYGTSYPYKEGAVPSNPHIQYVSIAPQTSGGGNLPTNIHVAAQNN